MGFFSKGKQAQSLQALNAALKKAIMDGNDKEEARLRGLIAEAKKKLQSSKKKKPMAGKKSMVG